MANVLLGVTGSVAAIHTPALFEDLRRAGHAAKVVATRAALYFFDPADVLPAAGRRDAEVVILDEDEWPGQDLGRRYRRGDVVVHIELRRWADAMLIAPLDANTLAKLACGLADNCLTCVWRAWDWTRPVLLAPAMNTLMWENPLTTRHLQQLAALHGVQASPPQELHSLPTWLNQHCSRLGVVPPISKRLACDDVGTGAMAERPEILAALEQLLRQSQAAR
jgi:phosphopantothenoylcysteine decarboxylase